MTLVYDTLILLPVLATPYKEGPVRQIADSRSPRMIFLCKRGTNNVPETCNRDRVDSKPHDGDVIDCFALMDGCKEEVTMILAWPKKTREIHNHHIDSTVWNDFKFRDDDIIISTYNKSGTTWMQQIVSQLLFNGETRS